MRVKQGLMMIAAWNHGGVNITTPREALSPALTSSVLSPLSWATHQPVAAAV